MSFWDDRYRGETYAYGTEPNDFLRASAMRIPPGRVLCLAEGEGRNAVFLAALGYEVTAVDLSSEGLRKRDVHEGTFHGGRSATVQIIGSKA
jgi:SAM-dependent methyltransferase